MIPRTDCSPLPFLSPLLLLPSLRPPHLLLSPPPLAPTPPLVQAPAPVIEYLTPASAVFQASAPVLEFIAPAPAVIPSPAPVEEYISPASGVFQAPEFFAPAPSVIQSAAPVVEYFSSAPHVIHETTPVVEHFSPVPAVFHSHQRQCSSLLHPHRWRVPSPAPYWWSTWSPASGVFQAPEFFAPAPSVIQSAAPVVEYFSSAPHVIHETTPVVEHFSPVPAVFHSPAPVFEYIALVPVESPSAVTGGDGQASVPGQSSTVRRGAGSSVGFRDFSPRRGSTALLGAGSCECLFLGSAKLYHCRDGPWEPCRVEHAMLLRHRSTGRVRFEMFHLEHQTVAYQCDVAELVLKKPPDRETSWLNKNPPAGHMWVQGRLTKKQVTTRPGCTWLEEWSRMSKSSQRKTTKKTEIGLSGALQSNPNQPTRTVQAGSDSVQVIGLKFKR